MKKSQSSKIQSEKKENTKVKGKENPKKEQKGNKIDKKEKKEQIPEEDFDYYTPEEIKLLDKYHLFSGNKFVDEEIYDIIMKCNKDEKMIKEELKQRLKEFERGDEYNWTEIGESEYIFL
jgi:hypothetical protein